MTVGPWDRETMRVERVPLFVVILVVVSDPPNVGP